MIIAKEYGTVVKGVVPKQLAPTVFKKGKSGNPSGRPKSPDKKVLERLVKQQEAAAKERLQVMLSEYDNLVRLEERRMLTHDLVKQKILADYQAGNPPFDYMMDMPEFTLTGKDEEFLRDYSPYIMQRREERLRAQIAAGRDAETELQELEG